MRRLAWLIAGAVALAQVAPVAVHDAAAADAGARVRARLKKGRALYDAQEYRKAARELAPVARDPAATRAQKLEALELLGLCWFILGDQQQARDAFEDLLAIDPGYQLREASGSPKIGAFFDKVKQAYGPDAGGGRASLEHAAPPSGTAGRKLELEATVIAGADLVKDVQLHWRRQGELSYHDVAMSRGKGTAWRARFTPPADPTGYVLEYWLEAHDLGGRGVARVGGPDTPLELKLRGAARVVGTVWYRRWYVWAGAGVVVLGTAAAITAAATASSAPDGTLGTVTLP